ncbi:hypothetical protein [Pontibacillus litoralis]|uniref:Uncharacterized protein n=1 Tax=Pontibacillus litoralis JSM 072002 TaxID=1385512 RepID=A0A0A5HQI8_9BACI|nr:hypothetical protein [Pontibacillus litoralis]KGX85887.1 hypothetical protein N784_06700 [Pontibacillus litoralis JSM 072002]
MEPRIYEREKLYKEVWEIPMTTLSKRYGVSDVALRKQCLKMNIPLPKAGHWVKVKSGHKVNIPPLPKYDGPSKIVVHADSSDSISRKMDDNLLFLSENERQRVKKYCFSLTVPDKLTKPHDLIKESKQYYRYKDEDTRPRTGKIIDINVSSEQKERAYRIYNTLFRALEFLGYTIEIGPPEYHGYYKHNELHVRLNSDSVPIFIREKQRGFDHKPTKEELNKSIYSIPTYDYKRTGKLHLGIDFHHAKRKNWNDTETKKIEEQIGEIVIWIMEAIHVKKSIREEHEIERKRRLEEKIIQEEIQMKKEEELKKVELLNQYAIDWEKADRIRRFAYAVEFDIAKGDQNENLIEWLKWAKAKADWIDPLVDKSDEILGEKDSLFKNNFCEDEKN